MSSGPSPDLSKRLDGRDALPEMFFAADSIRTAEDQPPSIRMAAVLDPKEARERIRRRKQTIVPLSLTSLNEVIGGGIAGMDVLVLVGPPRSAKTTIGLWIGLAVARATGKKLFIYAPDQGSMAVFRWLEKAVAREPDPDAALRELVVVVDETQDNTDLESVMALLRYREKEVAAVLLDSAQTLLAPGTKDEMARVTASMSAAKRIGDELIIPVIVTSQANRSSWRSARTEDRSSPLSAGLNSSAIEYRATIQIFTEKVSTKEMPPEFRLTVAKSAHGRDDCSFRLRLDPATMEFTEFESVEDFTDRPPEDEARLWKDLVGDAIPVLRERWTAGENPTTRDFGARLRVARRSRRATGPGNDRLIELVAYLEKTGVAVVNPGPRGAKLLCRPVSGAGEA